MKFLMPIVNPFYSMNGSSTVYHNNDGCRTGKTIEKDLQEEGTRDNRRLCKLCRKLNKEEQGLTLPKKVKRE
jgi:hypothetical protein